MERNNLYESIDVLLAESKRIRAENKDLKERVHRLQLDWSRQYAECKELKAENAELGEKVKFLRAELTRATASIAEDCGF